MFFLLYRFLNSLFNICDFCVLGEGRKDLSCHHVKWMWCLLRGCKCCWRQIWLRLHLLKLIFEVLTLLFNLAHCISLQVKLFGELKHFFSMFLFRQVILLVQVVQMRSTRIFGRNILLVYSDLGLNFVHSITKHPLLRVHLKRLNLLLLLRKLQPYLHHNWGFDSCLAL